MKYVSANFNSTLNYAINEKNELYHFGENQPIEKLNLPG
jgi:hypothetical protein